MQAVGTNQRGICKRLRTESIIALHLSPNICAGFHGFCKTFKCIRCQHTYVYYIIRMQSALSFITSASMARAALYALFDLGPIL